MLYTEHTSVALVRNPVVCHARGGTLGISERGYVARTLEPLASTRASFRRILLP